MASCNVSLEVHTTRTSLSISAQAHLSWHPSAIMIMDAVRRCLHTDALNANSSICSLQSFPVLVDFAILNLFPVLSFLFFLLLIALLIFSANRSKLTLLKHFRAVIGI